LSNRRNGTVTESYPTAQPAETADSRFGYLATRRRYKLRELRPWLRTYWRRLQSGKRRTLCEQLIDQIDELLGRDAR